MSSYLVYISLGSLLAGGIWSSVAWTLVLNLLAVTFYIRDDFLFPEIDRFNEALSNEHFYNSDDKLYQKSSNVHFTSNDKYEQGNGASLPNLASIKNVIKHSNC